MEKECRYFRHHKVNISWFNFVIYLLKWWFHSQLLFILILLLGGRLCHKCSAAFSSIYPTDKSLALQNESIKLRNVIASQIDAIDNVDSGLGVGDKRKATDANMSYNMKWVILLVFLIIIENCFLIHHIIVRNIPKFILHFCLMIGRCDINF